MHLRRSFALTAAALALAAPALTSCGFDYATDRIYTPATGVNNRDGDVDVLGAVVVSSQADSGTFIATFVQQLHHEPASLTELAGRRRRRRHRGRLRAGRDRAGRAGQPRRPTADLRVTGDFEAGDFVDASRSPSTTASAPTSTSRSCPTCGDFEGLDGLDAASRRRRRRRGPESRRHRSPPRPSEVTR